MKILIVDDNEINRQLLEMAVADYDYEFCTAENGQQAIDAVMADEFIDLVLMDINMPVLDGIDAARIIKTQCTNRFIPIIFVTALDDNVNLAKCLASGGDDYIPKPINEEVLLAKIKAHGRTVSFYQQIRSTNEELAYHRRLIEREHNIVENIFSRCTNRMEKTCDNVRYYMSPMSQFNGDILLTDKSFNGGVYILLGDFTGHGLAAATGCLPVADVFFAMTRKKASVGNIAREINGKLSELLPDNMFFCATIVELDPSGDRLTMWSGGMNDMLILDGNGKYHASVEAQHMPLGILDTKEFDDTVEIITPFSECKAYIYTDGVVEANDDNDQYFGEEGLLDLLQNPNRDAINEIEKCLEVFTGGSEQTDDIGLVEIAGGQVTFKGEVAEVAQNFNVEAVLPWHINLEMTHEELKNTGTMDQIVGLISGVKSAKQHESILYAVLTELYSNALEHGILGLDSDIKNEENGFEKYYELRDQRLNALSDGKITVDIKINSNASSPKLIVEFTDTGAGFDTSKINNDMDNNDGAFARGVGLVESLCDSLHYSNHGRTVTMQYSLRS